MQYVCVDPVEFLYTDTKEYKSGTDMINILTPRGSYACAQILLTECSDSIEVSCDGWDPEIYEMVTIHVEANPMYSWNNAAPHTPEKKAPFEVYDCLKPYCGAITPKKGQAAVYFSMQIPKDSTSARHSPMRGSICPERASGRNSPSFSDVHPISGSMSLCCSGGKSVGSICGIPDGRNQRSGSLTSRRRTAIILR